MRYREFASETDHYANQPQRLESRSQSDYDSMIRLPCPSKPLFIPRNPGLALLIFHTACLAKQTGSTGMKESFTKPGHTFLTKENEQLLTNQNLLKQIKIQGTQTASPRLQRCLADSLLHKLKDIVLPHADCDAPTAGDPDTSRLTGNLCDKRLHMEPMLLFSWIIRVKTYLSCFCLYCARQMHRNQCFNGHFATNGLYFRHTIVKFVTIFAVKEK